MSFKLFRLVSLLTLMLISTVKILFAQNLTDLDNELPPQRDSILSIRNISNANDSIKVREMIAITYEGTLPKDSLKSLYLDGIYVPDSNPSKIMTQEKIIFFANDERVQKILRQFTEGEDDSNPFLPVHFGLGNPNRMIVSSKSNVYVEVHQLISYWWFVLSSLLIAFLIYLAIKYNALKDDNNTYFSLGRTQLFFWTLLVMIAYFYICFKTNSLPDIPSSVLVILGISVTTTGATRLIDSRPKKEVVIDPNAKSEGFIIDILSDGSSINIQRFQNVAFNLFFGILFIQKALTDHLLPNFDQNVLILLGLSSGTYAGLKITEGAKDQKAVPKITVGDEISGTQPPTPVSRSGATSPSTFNPTNNDDAQSDSQANQNDNSPDEPGVTK